MSRPLPLAAVHVLALATLAALAPASRAQPIDTPRGTWRVEAEAGHVDPAASGLDGLSLGARAGLQLGRRSHLRLGVSRFSKSIPGIPDTRPAPVPGTELRSTVLEVGGEVDLYRGRQVVIGLVGSAVWVHGRASDAEEWDLARSSSLGGRAAITSRFPLGRRIYLRPELGFRSFGGLGPHPRGTAPIGFPTVKEETTDWEISLGVGWVLPGP